MIAVDTSTWIAYLQGAGGDDTDLLEQALRDRQVVMIPVVLTELLSDPKLTASVFGSLLDLPMAETRSGFWQRAGILRAKALAKHRKARLGDALIAQTCIDNALTLVTRDRDFRAFADTTGLDLFH